MQFDNNNPSLEKIILSAIDNKINNSNNVQIAKITKVNESTINCKCVINKIVNGKEIEFPEFIEVPVLHIQGGGSSLLMPISPNDYCIIFFNDRCFDNWYLGKDFTGPAEFRKNDFSDAIALVGINNKSGGLEIPTTATFTGDLIHNGNLQVNGNVEINGNLQVNGNITGTGTLNIPTIITTDIIYI